MNIIFKTVFGSHVYGTNTPSSDTDYKGIFIPAPKDIILQRAPKSIEKSTGNDNSKNSKDDVDEGLYSLQHFLKQLCDGQTYALDMIFTPEQHWLTTSPEWESIVANRHRFLSKNVSSFAGYCQQQASKYSLKGSNLAAYRMVCDFFGKRPVNQKINSVIEDFKTEVLSVSQRETMFHDKGESIIKIVSIPHKVTGVDELYIQVGPKTKVPFNASCGVAYDTYKRQFDLFGERAKLAETNQGVDFKALSHAVRVCREAEELLLTGQISFPLTDPLIMKIKAGNVPYKEISEVIENGLGRINEAKLKSTLPEKPDFAFAEELVHEAYLKAILNQK